MSCTKGALDPSRWDLGAFHLDAGGVDSAAGERREEVLDGTDAHALAAQRGIQHAIDDAAALRRDLQRGSQVVRTKTMPLSAGAGARVSRTASPVCSPMPSMDARCLNVRWWKNWPSIVRWVLG